MLWQLVINSFNFGQGEEFGRYATLIWRCARNQMFIV